MARIVISPLDSIMQRYGEQLASLGNVGKVHKVIARATNYEGRKAFVQVKRAVRRQSSIPNAIVQRSMKFQPASTKGGAVEAAIVGKGRELSLKLFGPRQFKAGTRAKVWGQSKMHRGAFIFAGNYKSGNPVAYGHVFKNTRKWNRKAKRFNAIEIEFGPSVPREMVKDESKHTFYAAAPRIVDRVGKEIAAVLRGF